MSINSLAVPAVSDTWIGRVDARLSVLRQLRETRIRREQLASELAALDQRYEALSVQVSGQACFAWEG